LVRADVLRIAEKRRANGQRLPAEQWAKLLACILNVSERGPVHIGGRSSFVTWPGLDKKTLEEDLRSIGIEADRQVISDAVDVALNRKRTIGAAEIGKRLKLTAAERKETKASNCDPIDETKAERAERRRAEIAAFNERKRRAAGMQTRKDWLKQNNLSKQKPWEAQGISRRTWYRLQAKLNTPNSQAQVGTGSINNLCHRRTSRPRQRTEQYQKGCC
jgi:hypothetical protein